MPLDYPDHLPANCPPVGTQPATGVVFHLVSSDPPNPNGSEADCRSRCEKFELAAEICADCKACGLSVFPSAECARKQYKINVSKFPRVAKKYMRYIAKAVLSQDHGSVKVTGGPVRTHMTLWFAKSLDVTARCKLFVVEEPSERT